MTMLLAGFVGFVVGAFGTLLLVRGVHGYWLWAIADCERLEARVRELEAEKHYAATIDAEMELLPRLRQVEQEHDALKAKLAARGAGGGII